jgi:diguanylate cyclase (GGDEF)-like protein
MLKDSFNLAMAASKRSGKYSALMVLDLDNFKPINDQYGHTAGDLLLMEASRRIASSLREIDTVARFGGDEFVVILTGLDIDKSQSEALALAVAEKIRLKVAEPYIISTKTEAGDALEIEHHCTSSIGIALFFGSAASQEDVFKWADMAMYMAKEAGRNQIKVHID